MFVPQGARVTTKSIALVSRSRREPQQTGGGGDRYVTFVLLQ